MLSDPGLWVDDLLPPSKAARRLGWIRLEGLFVRVSGGTGQESSLATQEAELRARSAGEVARVFLGPGIGNELYTGPKTSMYFAGAKTSLAGLAAVVKVLVG
jgi:hypothetical protein